ncbi:hypothetical protein RND81_03G030400 [Saponaria officinalis]|uniref:Transmembrane protein n=1 Tax=Saponaria officinalis TaxID=3572 RepID=A0AAW1M485_SAPOF
MSPSLKPTTTATTTDLRQNLLTSLDKLSDRSTFPHSSTHLSHLAQSLPSDHLPIFISCILTVDAAANLLIGDWGSVVIAVVLFVLLQPGLLFQIPGRGRVIEFGNMHTSGASILVHTIIYFGLITILLIAVGVHIYAG